MLHAFNQKNVRRILLSRQAEHINDKNEDAITSMVFSPLTFMSTRSVSAILAEIIGSPMDERIAGREVQRHEVSLWPSDLRSTSWAGTEPSRCEPDILIRLEFDRGSPLNIIGEMKWDWDMHPDPLRREIERQQEAVANSDKDADQISLVVTLHRPNYQIPIAVQRTWKDVHEACLKFARHSLELAEGRWGLLVSSFLDKAEQVVVQGFDTIVYSASEPMGPMFWKDAAANGLGAFAGFDAACRVQVKTNRPVFWSEADGRQCNL